MAEFVRFTLEGSNVMFESAESDLVTPRGEPPKRGLTGQRAAPKPVFTFLSCRDCLDFAQIHGAMSSGSISRARRSRAAPSVAHVLSAASCIFT